MEEIICMVGPNERAYVAYAIVAWQLVEYWLGKTDKTKSGSTLELFMNIFNALKAKVFGPKQRE